MALNRLLELVAGTSTTLLPIQSTSGAGDADKIIALDGTTGLLHKSFIPTFDSVDNGGVPFSGGGTTNFLRADGTWSVPPGGASSDSFKTHTVTDTDSGTWAATGSAVATLATDTLTWVSGLGINVDVDATLKAIRVSANVTTLPVGVPVTGDWLVFDDATVSSKALISTIPLSIFTDDLGHVENVSTSLSNGTVTATTYDIDSDGTSVTLVEATTTLAGLLGAAKWNEIVASTSHLGDTSIHFTKGSILLDDLSDVVETTITTGDLLRWNGANWVNYADSNFAASGHTHDANSLTGTTLATGVVTSSLTTVGTIGTGLWQGTAVTEVYGGTGQTIYAIGDLLYAATTTTLTKLVVGTNTHVLTLTGGVPTWAAPAGGASALNDLTDVDTTGVTTGDLLFKNTTNYEVTQGAVSWVSPLFTINGTQLVTLENAPSSSLSTVLTVERMDTGTPLAGSGPSIDFRGEGSTGTSLFAGRIGTPFTDTTASFWDTNMHFYLPKNGATKHRLLINGFYGGLIFPDNGDAFDNFRIGPNTPDGADDATVTIQGGGGALVASTSTARGAFLQLKGNEGGSGEI